VNPFQNIIRLSVGDFVAKTLNFFASVYLARVLGVTSYGTLEFALSILTYFLFLADGGLELWATREAAQGRDIRDLAARIVPLRLVLAASAFGFLLILQTILPDYPALKTVLVLFGLTLFPQAVSLKWVFMGQEQMTRVAAGLVTAQVVFVTGVFAFVHSPVGIVWIPVLRLVADLIMAAYFLRLFASTYGGVPWPLKLQGASAIVRPALVMGGSQALGIMSYNFDSILLGWMLGPAAVGLYSAAYKPVTAALAMPVTYYQGLFPALSRTFASNRSDFHQVVARSLQITSIFALPLGVIGTFFAAPIIDLLFGAPYAGSVPALQLLAWSAVLTTLRGTFKHGLNAAGRAELDLRCGTISVIANITLNLLLIPRFGILGAAAATVSTEALWFITAAWYFNRRVASINLYSVLVSPVAACAFMAVCLNLVQSAFWGLQVWIGAAVYLGTLFACNRKRGWGPKTIELETVRKD